MLLKWLTTLKTLVVKTNNMSSKFSSSFLSKSPLLAGEYGSGVDGMRYFSPKQPASKNPAKPTVPKKQDKPVKDITGDDPVEEIITTDDKTTLPSEIVVEEQRKLDRKEPGKTIIVQTDQEKYLKSFEAGFIKDNEGFDNITDYRKNREKQNAARNFQQNQSRSITTDTDVEGVETITTGEWGNVGDEIEIKD